MKKPVLIATITIMMLAGEAAVAADHPWQINSADGKSAFWFGFLSQGQAEVIKNKSGKGNSQDLYLRRFRLIAGGKVTDKLSFFIDTDSPNLGKGSATGVKVDERVFLQDAILTYTFRPQLQLDAGLLLVTLSHNTGQGATTLLPVDYGPYSFLASEPTGSRVGRDYGLQARGYLFKQHFEYRVAALQGIRAPTQSGPFRCFGRAVWYPFEAEIGYFYSGTSLGAKKIMALGASLDHQKDYNAQTVDFFYDQPLRNKNSMTIQAAYTHYDGGATFTQLPAEHILFFEAGYYHARARLGPFLQLSGRLFKDASRHGLGKYVGGLAYWPLGHRLNLKVGVARATGDSKQDFWQFVFQGQVYIF
jgi:hypothetical protein